jgi:hypothetical protein
MSANPPARCHPRPIPWPPARDKSQRVRPNRTQSPPRSDGCRRNAGQHRLDRRRAWNEVHEQSRESLRRSGEGNESLSRLIGEVGQVEATVKEIAEFRDRVRAQHRIDHQHDPPGQGHCRPDQPAGAQCRDRGRTCRRTGSRLCRGCRRSAQAREKSSASASEIDAVTHTLAQQAEVVRRSIESGLEHIASSQNSMNTVAEVLASASTSVTEVGRGLDAIASATDEQRRVSGEVAQNIESISAMSRDNAHAVEQTACIGAGNGSPCRQPPGHRRPVPHIATASASSKLRDETPAISCIRGLKPPDSPSYGSGFFRSPSHAGQFKPIQSPANPRSAAR